MAFTISYIASATSTASSSSISVAFPAGTSAAVGDWIVAIVAADNAGAAGAASITTMADSAGNTYTKRGQTNSNSLGTTSNGATLAFFTAPVTTALAASNTITCSFSPATIYKTIHFYRVQPGSGESITFSSVGTGVTSASTLTPTATGVSVSTGQVIFGASAIETNNTITGDSDTTNGSWSTLQGATATAGTTGTSMQGRSQYKIATGTGTQTYSQTIATAASDSAINTLILALTASGPARRVHIFT